MIGVSLDAEPRATKDGGKRQAEIAIGEEDDTQATRS